MALIVIIALSLLGLLALASTDTDFFNRYYSWLYAGNIVVAFVFAFIVAGLAILIFKRFRQKRFGSRLLGKLALFFTLVGVMPGTILYLVSLQFAERSIESWFDVRIDKALTAGLDFGRAALESMLVQLQHQTSALVQQSDRDRKISEADLMRWQEQLGALSLSLLDRQGNTLFVIPKLKKTNNARDKSRDIVQRLPESVLRQALTPQGYTGIEGNDEDLFTEKNHQDLRFRVIVPLLSRDVDEVPARPYFLEVIQLVPQRLAYNAVAVQNAYSEYQEKAIGHAGFRKMYIGTLTLSLLFGTFIAMMLAFVLGNQLVRPLVLLAQGTKEVSEGDLTPKREMNTHDELGFLTQSFNAMTKQLSEARVAVESNQRALQNSNTYLESILSNLTTGVFVFDKDFRLNKANPGAERIFKTNFQTVIHEYAKNIPVLITFAHRLQEAFSKTHFGFSASVAQADWQQQMELLVEGASEPMILLVRGTRLPSPLSTAYETGEFIVVFDDIGDVITAQRAIVWSEVGRRLAHEIKNPLTPIQLTAERLEQKLHDRLLVDDAKFLSKSITTIVNQVTVMKDMVDDFRMYSMTPPVNFQKLQLNDLIDEILGLYDANDADHVIQAQLDSQLPEIYGDTTQLRQIIHNLLQNAQDATAQTQAPQIFIETKTIVCKPEQQGKTGSQTDFENAQNIQYAVCLSVIDNGSGFSAQILNKAFEPYVTTKSKGTGLGLAIVKKIVDEHGASIQISNLFSEDQQKCVGAQIQVIFINTVGDKDS